MDRRFPRTHRLRRPAEFRVVFDHGRSRADGRFVVYARPRESGEPTRLGLVVSRRFGPAHRRNAWKRIVREAFRLSREHLPPGHDLVVLPVGPDLVPDLRGAEESLVRVSREAAGAYARRGPRG